MLPSPQCRRCGYRAHIDSGTLQMRTISQRRAQERGVHDVADFAVEPEILDNRCAIPRPRISAVSCPHDGWEWSACFLEAGAVLLVSA